MDIFQEAVSDVKRRKAAVEKAKSESKKKKESGKPKVEYPEVPREYYFKRVYTESRRRLIVIALDFARHDYEYQLERYKRARERLTFAQKSELIRETRKPNPDLSFLPWDFQAAHYAASMAKRAYLNALDEYTVAHWWRHRTNGAVKLIENRESMLQDRSMRV